MMPVSPLETGLLCLAAFFAGTIDAIAGGGGLITVPALLAAGLPPHMALATNKGQSVWGSGAAIIRYARAGLFNRRAALLSFPLALLGSAAGAMLVLRLRPDFLRPLILVLLVIAAGVVAFSRVRPEADGPSRPGSPLLLGGIALLIGGYDGFFGPGTGTFLITAYVVLLGLSFRQATANAKIVNFASNLAALAVFAVQGAVVWSLAAPMLVAQVAGGWTGAHLAVKGGSRFVRLVVFVVALALVAKVGYDFYASRG